MAAEIIHGLNSFFTFRINSVLFAVNIGQVTKILEMTEITRVPNTPSHFNGIINSEGNVLPVFNGRLKLGFSDSPETKNTCILVLVFELDGQTVSTGIVVDSVEKVIVFGPDQIISAPSSEWQYNAEFIDGITSLNQEQVIILNLEKIFSEEEVSFFDLIK